MSQAGIGVPIAGTHSPGPRRSLFRTAPGMSCFALREGVMAHDEILWRVMLPVECPDCSHRTPQTIAGLIARDNVICASCGYSINLKSEAWRNFTKTLAERLSGLVIPPAKS